MADPKYPQAPPIRAKDLTVSLGPLHPAVGQKAVYLFRHGHTRYNEQGQSSIDYIRGWTDIDLDAGGKEDAKIIGEMAKTLGIEVIVSSDLIRAVETAEIIGDILGLPLSAKTPAFRPWNLGELQGQPTHQVKDDIKRYINDAHAKQVPGGESFDDFKERFLSGLRSVTDLIDNNIIQRIAIVTHFRGLKMADAWTAAGGGNDYNVDVDHFTRNDAKPGAVLQISPRKSGGWEGDLIFKGFYNVGKKIDPVGHPPK